MLVDTIKAYLQAKQSEISGRSDHLLALKRVAQAYRAQEAMIASNPKMSQGFIRISRVAQGDPVTLFGADVPSHAFNRIEIFEGQDAEDGSRVVGRSLYSVLMNEQNLTELVMKPNRGEAMNWATSESVMGYRLGPYTPEEPNERDLFDGQLDDSIVRSRDPIAFIIDRLKRAKVPLSAKSREEISRDLKRVNPAENVKFAQKRLRETLGQKLVKLKLEASHTLLNLDRILTAKQQLLLAPPAAEAPRSYAELDQERLRNPILNGLMERYDENERVALLEVVSWAIIDYAKANGVEGFDPMSTDSFGKVLGAMVKNTDSVEQKVAMKSYSSFLSRMHNRLTNPSILERCEDRDPRRVTMSLTHRGMDRRAMHSDFATSSGDGIVLMISRAVAESFFGDLKVRAGAQIFEIHMTSEEFMLALRGHPEGEAVRCTLHHVVGNHIQPVAYSSRYEDAMRQEREDIDVEVRGPRQHAMALAQKIADGIANKGQLEALIDELRDLNAEFNKCIDRIDTVARGAADNIEVQVGDHYRDSMVSIGEALKSVGTHDTRFIM